MEVKKISSQLNLNVLVGVTLNQLKINIQLKREIIPCIGDNSVKTDLRKKYQERKVSIVKITLLLHLNLELNISMLLDLIHLKNKAKENICIFSNMEISIFTFWIYVLHMEAFRLLN
jgi:hypothetical protein